MSTVTFTTTLVVSLTEFNSKRDEYVTGVAQALWVPLASVVIGQVSENPSARRLLSTIIVVVNTVTVPTDDAQTVSTAVTSNNLDNALSSRAIAMQTVSTTTVVTLSVEKLDDPQNTQLVAILASCAALFLLVSGVAAWSIYNRHKNHAYSSV